MSQFATIRQADVVRAGASIAVFSYHLWSGLGTPLAGSTLAGTLDPIMNEGALGVVFFNFLSGFLLALPYLGSARKPFPSYAEFLRKRFLRIVPQYYLAALLIVLANMAIFKIDLSSSWTSLLTLLSCVQSWLYSVFNTNYAALWYIGPLVQFYLLFPLVLRWFGGMGSGKAVISAMVLSYGLCGLVTLYLAAEPDSILAGPGRMLAFNLPGRLPEFALGMWFSSVWRPNTRPIPQLVREAGFVKIFVSLAFVMALAWITPLDLPFPLSHMKKVAWCFLLFVPILFSRKAAAWGDLGWVKRFSAASYGFYLVHQPLLSYLRLPMPDGTGRIGAFVLTALFMIPVAYCGSLLLDRMAGGITSGFATMRAMVKRA